MPSVRIIEIMVPAEVKLTEKEAKTIIAVELYREGRLTLKQAAELAGYCLEDFMKELSKRKIGIVNWDSSELEEELRNAERLARQL